MHHMSNLPFVFGAVSLLVSGCTGYLSGEEGGTQPGGGLTSGPGNPAGGASGAPLDCSRPTSPRAPLRRLTRFEYNNTVRDLSLAEGTPADRLPGEEAGNGFGNDADALGVSPLLIEGYLTLAREIAEAAVLTPARIAALHNCDLVALGEQRCGEEFVKSFAASAFRRTLTSDELSTFVAVFENGRSQGATYEAGISDVIEATLQAPQFLYRVELGQETGIAGLGRPTDYEMASRLSYLLWGSTPDAELLALADNGQLRTPQQIASQAQRLLGDPRTREMVKFFHSQWLGIRGLNSLVRNETFYPTFQPGMGALFREETERFMDSVVFEGAGTLNALYEADYTFVNGPLAQFYGWSGVSGNDFRKVPTDPSRRRGLLTHASVLAKTTPGSRTDPVVRGRWAFTKLLCGSVADPPPNIPELPEPTPGASVRERLAQHRAVEPCRTCHLDMDPLGFAFENYDGVGLWRDEDNGVAVDASAEIYKTDAKGAFVGVVQLAEKLAASNDAKACYVGQWLTYAYGRAETEADACTRAHLDQRFKAAGGAVPQLLLALTETDAFLYRPSASSGGGALP